MRPYLAELADVADTLVSAHPNAGLPNAMGEYDETPARHVLPDRAVGQGRADQSSSAAAAARRRSTSPTSREHVSKYPPRKVPEIERRMRLSGLEPFVHG